LSGFPNRSVEADQELWELAEFARARENLRRAILGSRSSDALKALARSEPDWFGRFQDWLDSYGHRVFDLDILHETMQDDPAIALKIIRNYIEHPTKSPASRQKLRTEERAAAVIVFQKALAKRFLTKGFIKKFLSLAQKYAAIRENRPFILHLGWPSMRKDVLALGRRLAASRVLNEPEEVFFLTAEELRSWSKRLAHNKHSKDLGNEDQKVRERRREWETQKALVPPEHLNLNKLIRFILQCFSSNVSGVDKSSLVLTGIPASPGRAKGKTCTVGSQSDFGKLKSGNILIAKYTTPVWTPLLSLAAGVITETGGALSHAAIIAREYGIPAVAGVAHATQIPDSTDVEVDGNIGHVYIRKGGPDQ
jgi:pyruvate,water dikinase